MHIHICTHMHTMYMYVTCINYGERWREREREIDRMTRDKNTLAHLSACLSLLRQKERCSIRLCSADDGMYVCFVSSFLCHFVKGRREEIMADEW